MTILESFANSKVRRAPGEEIVCKIFSSDKNKNVEISLKEITDEEAEEDFECQLIFSDVELDNLGEEFNNGRVILFAGDQLNLLYNIIVEALEN